MSWCKSISENPNDPTTKTFFKFPGSEDADEVAVWKELLGLDPSAVLGQRSLVGSWHFHDCDQRVDEGFDNFVVIGKLERLECTRHSTSTGNHSLTSPPRPAQSKRDYEESIFRVNEKMTMEYYNFIKPQLPSKKKRRGLSAKVVVPELEEVITKESIFSIPQRKKTFAQFGIVQVEMLHRLIEVVGHHHRNCPHKITHFCTTLNESYMHSMGIMLPKWGNNTKELYEVKESATFLIFVSSKKIKCTWQRC